LRNEIFISYSHRDVKHLQELRGHLVPFERVCGITVWDDQRIDPGNAWQSEIEAALNRAKIAVLLVTANFLASSFITESELPRILKNAQTGELKVLWIAVSKCAHLPPEITGNQAAHDTAKPLDLMPAPRRRAAWADIAKRIVDSCQAPGLERGPARPAESRSVLLAQVTDDMEEEAAQVRTYLDQYNDKIAILPTADYPQGGEAFKAAFDRDLGQVDLFVQLLGPRAGRTPPDLPEGYTRWQSERAKSAGSNVQILQWRHPQMDIRGVNDAAYKNTLTAETVVASGLETFKRQVLNAALKPAKKMTPPRASTVFINADEMDMGIAKEVERECLANALTTILPMMSASSESNRQDLTTNLIECDVLVFIYGDTSLEWIRDQLLFFNRVKPRREAPPKLLAICSGPPPKPDIGISFPNARLVNCPEGWNLEAIRKLIMELGA